MASSSGGSKKKKGLRNLLKETLHVRSRSKSPSQPSDVSQQPSSSASASVAAKEALPTKIPNVAWTKLCGSLQILRDSSALFHPLPSAIDTLVSCLDRFENVAKKWPDYEGLAVDLTTRSDSIVQYMSVTGDTYVPNAVFSLVLSIRKQVTTLLEELGSENDPVPEGPGPNNLRESCESIRSLFRQLEVNLREGVWVVSNKEMARSLLDGLGVAAEKITCDSGLSTSMRPTCTEGTRTGVLAQLDEWMGDPTAASVCWMSGREGTGKTTIARTFCKYFDDRKRLASSVFLTRGPTESADMSPLVCSIAYQLAQHSAPFQRSLCQALTDNPGVSLRDDPDTFRRLIQESLENAIDSMPKDMVVVIDGLDEGGSHIGREFTHQVLLPYADKSSLRFLVTSRGRREEQEETDSHGDAFETIHLDDIDRSTVRSEIGQYFRTELASLDLTSKHLDQLVDHTDMLFLCAAVLARFIHLHDTRSSPSERLSLVLSMTHESAKKHAYIDMAYTVILRSVLGGDETDSTRAVLRTVLFAQEAIAVETIGRLGGIDDPERVRLALQPLSPVLSISEEEQQVSALHSSFAEFMQSSERSGEFLYDIANHSRLIAERCFEVMKAELQFNICGLESSFVLDRGVENIESRIKDKISPTLAYACRYWPSHLELAAVSEDLVCRLEEFVSVGLLFWMEVLSLRRDMRSGVVGFLKVKRWLQLSDCLSEETTSLVEDAYSFVTSYAAHPVSESTPHIYLSSLAFCPQTSKIYQHYSRSTTGLLEMNPSLAGQRTTAALAIWKFESSVSPAAFSPDGNRILFSSGAGLVSICDAYTGAILLGPLQCHHSVLSVAYSPDGSKFATSSGDGTFRVWDATDGTLLVHPSEGHDDMMTCVKFSPDGKLIASSSWDCTVRIWNVTDGSMAIGPLNASYDSPIAFSPDGSFIATESGDHSVLLWALRAHSSPTAVLKGHSRPLSSILFSPDGSRLISCSRDGFVRVWRTSDGVLAMEFDCCPHVPSLSLADSYGAGRMYSSLLSMALSPDGRHLATGLQDGTIRVWNVDDGTLVVGPLFGHEDAVYGVSYSPDGTRIASYSSDQSIRIWSAREGALAPTHDSRMFHISSIMFSPSGSRIYTTSPCGVSLWDAEDGSLLTTLTSGRPQSACSLPISHDGTQIAVFLDDYSVEVLSTKDRSRIAGPLRGHTDMATCAAFSFDGAYLVTGSKDRSVRMWSLRDGELAAGPFLGHTKAVMQVVTSRDGSRVASYSLDGSIRAWNVGGSVIKVKSGALGRPISLSGSGCQSGMLDGWTIREDGWVTNGDGLLLFWVPLDFPCQLTPETELVITRFGSYSAPKHKLLLGHAWNRCYTGG